MYPPCLSSFLTSWTRNLTIINYLLYNVVKLDEVTKMKIEAIIHKAEEGGYWAEIHALPGCMTQGETMKELRKNMNEAVEGWMRVYEKQGIKKAGKSDKVKILRFAV